MDKTTNLDDHEQLLLKELLMNDGITDEAQNFINKLGLKNPGEFGNKVLLASNLSDEIKTLLDKSYELDKFNAFVSNMISLNRKVSDMRPEICMNKTYSKNLPKCSIVISFCNENIMTLLRTVHSVFVNSPFELIEEILLVDGGSTRGCVSDNALCF